MLSHVHKTSFLLYNSYVMGLDTWERTAAGRCWAGSGTWFAEFRVFGIVCQYRGCFLCLPFLFSMAFRCLFYTRQLSVFFLLLQYLIGAAHLSENRDVWVWHGATWTWLFCTYQEKVSSVSFQPSSLFFFFFFFFFFFACSLLKF